ncbi:MAG: DUF4397 domain-containing protein [Chloroflexota bacterium]
MIRSKILFNQKGSRLKACVFMIGLILAATLTECSNNVYAMELAQEEESQIRIVHMAPFSDGDTAVNVLVEGSIEAGNKTYGQSTQYFAYPSGDVTVSVELISNQTEVATLDLSLADATSYTIMVAGDGQNQPIEIVAVEDDNSTPAIDEFKIRVGHLAPFADDLAETTVDIRYDDGTLLFDDLTFGDVSDFVGLPAGAYNLQVTTADGLNTLIDFAPRDFAAGDIATLFATGDGSNQDLSAYLYPSTWYAFEIGVEVFSVPARVYVAHLAPFTSGNSDLSILLNNTLLYDNISYGETASYMDVTAGEYDINVFKSGETSVFASSEAEFEPGKDYTVVITGDVGNQAVSILSLEDDMEPAAAGKAKLRLGHLASFSDILIDTTVDIRHQDGTVLLGGVRYGDISDYIEVDAGEYDLQVTTPGGGTTLLDIIPVTINAGDRVSLFAVGNNSNQNLSMFAIYNEFQGFFVSMPAYIRVIHVAPFDSDAANTSVSVNVDGFELVADIQNGMVTDFSPVEPGEKLIEVIQAGQTDPNLSISGNFGADQRYTVLVTGDDDNRDLTVELLNDSIAGIDNPVSNLGLIRFAHAAPFSNAFSELNVDIRYDDGRLLHADVEYSEITSFTPFVPGDYNFMVTTPGGGEVLFDLRPIELRGNDVLTVFLIGDNDSQQLQTQLVYEAGRQDSIVTQTTTRVFVSHLAPFNVAANTAVSVTLQGQSGDPVVFTNVTYGDSVPYADLPSGTYTVEVTVAGSLTPAISDSFTFDLGKDYTVIAAGDGVNQPLQLIAVEDDNDPPIAGKGHVRFGHLAPFASTLAETTVDIRLQNGDLLLADVTFGTIAATYLELDAGTVDVKITTPGGGETLIDPLPVELADGDVVSLFATGGVNESVNVYAIDDPANSSGSFVGLAANVYIAHLAPFASGDAAVVVSVDGEDTLLDFGYGDSTGYLAIPAGGQTIAITPVGATDPAISATVVLTQGLDFTAVAIGDGANLPLELDLLVDDNSAPAAGKGKVRIGHLAPFADSLAGTLVDVRLQDGTLLQNDVEFKDLFDYIQLDAGEVDLKITSADGTTTLINPPSITLAVNDVVTIFATGDNDNQELKIYTIYNGDMGSFVEQMKIFLPMIFH